jgi:excisionase family DNA binding protein
MRQDYWEFEPTHTVFMAVNHKPIVWGTDNAIWRRIKLIPFTETIAPSDTSFVWTRESAGEILEFRRPDTGGRVQDLAIERLTVAQAAARLGVSQDAVRKRIKRGTIEYEQDQDGRLHVYLDPLEVYETRQDRAADEPTERLAWAQHQEIEFLRRELETRTEEIRRRDSIMAALTQRIPELEGPSQPPTTEDAGAEDNERREENSAGSGGIRRRARRRPGWRRAALLAGLSLGIVVLWFIAVMVGLTLLQP